MPAALKHVARVVLVATPLFLTARGMADAPQLQWSESRDLAGDSDGGLIVVGDCAGGVYMIGATPLFAGGEDAVIIRYDAEGDELWMRTYTGLGPNTYEYPADALVDAAGDLYLTCQSSVPLSTIDSEWATMKLDGATGATLWEQRHFGTGTFGTALPRDMAMGPDGAIAVAGWTADDDSWQNLGVVLYDAGGTELWSRQLSSPGYHAESTEAVAIGPDGQVAVGGTWIDAVGGPVMATVLYDAAGTLLWSRLHDASAVAELEDRVSALAFDADGNVLVAGDGIDNFTDGRDFVLLKYAPDGTLLWARRVIEPTSDFAPAMHLDAAGRIHLGGTSNGGHRSAVFDGDGNQLWTHTHVGALSDDGRRDHLAVAPDGASAVLLRTVFTPGIVTFTIVRRDADGALLDETSLDPGGVSRFPQGLARDAAGDLFATGYWSPTGDRDMLLFKLSPGPTSLPGDVTGDAVVDVNDLVAVILAWGACAGPCPEDLDASGAVDVVDLVRVVLNWS